MNTLKNRYLAIASLAFLLSGCSVALFDKPGAEALRTGIERAKQQQYQQTEQSLLAAIDAAIDHETKAKAMVELADLYASGYIPGKTTQDVLNLAVQAAELGNHYGFQAATDILFREGNPDHIRAAYQRIAPYSHSSPEAAIAAAELAGSKQTASKHLSRAMQLLPAPDEPRVSLVQRVANILASGQMVDRDVRTAEQWYRRAISRGSNSAIMELADLLEENQAPAHDIIVLWQQAANNGDTNVLAKLAFAHEQGWGTPRDTNTAMNLFARSVAANPENAYKIARIYEKLSIQKPEYAAYAAQWFEASAKLGDPNGLLLTARMYWAGEHFPEDIDKARTYYQQAIEAGNDKAATELALREERIQTREAELARREAEKQRKAFVRAQQRQQKLSAKSSSSQSVRSEKHDALYKQGLAYIKGQGVTKDIAKGKELLAKSAEQNNSLAMLELANIYKSGLGGQMDLKSAYGWYHKAAELNNAEAQYQLGLGYARGIGVEPNKTLAKKWLSSAENNGYVLADELLPTMSE